MSEEEILAKAYRILGLEPGASMDAINRRYKRLIMVWHPDRFPTDDGKKDAEEELKQINDAKDKLKKHFETAHKTNGSCACKPTAGAGPTSSTSTKSRSGQGPGPGPGRRKTTQETDREEAEAQRRNEERARQAAAEAAEKDRQAREAANAAAAAQKSAQQAIDQEKLIQDERLRWKITLCLAAAWIGLSIAGWAGMGLKHWWHDVSWKWQNSSSSSNSGSPNYSTTAPTSQPTYVAPYNQPPSQNTAPKLWQDPYANNAVPPPGQSTSTGSPNSLSGVGTSPFPSAPVDAGSVRERAQNFLNGGSQSTNP